MNPVIVKNVKIGEGVPKICVPIVGENEKDIYEQAEHIKSTGTDIVEWRVDWYEGVFEVERVKTVLKTLREILEEIPLLFTFRSIREGGKKEMEEKQYVLLNQNAIESGCVDLIDVEISLDEEKVRDLIEKAHCENVKVIISNHDFSKTPDKEELVQRLCRMQMLGADISKIAVMPRTKADVLTLLAATSEMAECYAKGPIITMSMAGNGVISRLSGEIFGSAVTFGSAGKTSAPGQMDVDDLQHILRAIHIALS